MTTKLSERQADVLRRIGAGSTPVWQRRECRWVMTRADGSNRDQTVTGVVDSLIHPAGMLAAAPFDRAITVTPAGRAWLDANPVA